MMTWIDAHTVVTDRAHHMITVIGPGDADLWLGLVAHELHRVLDEILKDLT